MASKKLVTIFALFITLSIILSSVFVIAQDEVTIGSADSGTSATGSEAAKKVGSGIAEKVTNLIEFVREAGSPIFRYLLGPTDSGEDLTAKSLMFFLVTLVAVGVLGAADNPFGSGWINVVVGAIVSILGIRFLPPDFITMITIPSQAFVAAAVTLIPFILFFFLIEKSLSGSKSRALRKICWIAFGVLMLALWTYNYNNEKLFNTKLGWLAWWSYPVVAVAACAMMKYDGTIQAWFAKEQAISAIEEARAAAATERALRRIDIIKKGAKAETPGEAALLKKQAKTAEETAKEMENG